MAHQRRKGWKVSTYQAPAELIAAAKTKAQDDGTTVSAVIRSALEHYVGGLPQRWQAGYPETQAAPTHTEQGCEPGPR